MDEYPRFRTQLMRPKFKRSVLTIPGTHGTWANHRLRGASRTGVFYVRTKPTRQVSYFLTWGWTYYICPETGEKVKVI